MEGQHLEENVFRATDVIYQNTNFIQQSVNGNQIGVSSYSNNL
jgi:hypothetical protein